ncbi:hypothetical protein [Anaerosporobacter sp.]|uniref:hypothetical protein n=1 Tax=Anaerosporobacter sp. TaxID=1872529 RepID=UPI00286F0F61|nr:hypothetical protein [Anaerosporobacter sp.]
MFGKKKDSKLQGVIELSAMEADAIIASGSARTMPKEGWCYDYGQNHQMQMTLNKLHGK